MFLVFVIIESLAVRSSEYKQMNSVLKPIDNNSRGDTESSSV